MNAKLNQNIPDELNQKIEQMKARLGMSKTSIVNAAIEEYLRTRDTVTLEKRVAKLEKEVFGDDPQK